MEDENGVTNSINFSSIASKYKVVFLGDACVGKTCLINRFINDDFEDDYRVLLKNNIGHHWH